MNSLTGLDAGTVAAVATVAVAAVAVAGAAAVVVASPVVDVGGACAVCGLRL